MEDSRIKQKSSQGLITAAHAFVKAMLRLGLRAPLVARNKGLTYLSFVFCSGHFEFLLRGLLVRSLEPKLRKSGRAREFENSRR